MYFYYFLYCRLLCCTAELSSTFLESNHWNTKVEMPQIPNGEPCLGPFR